MTIAEYTSPTGVGNKGEPGQTTTKLRDDAARL
jgi:hypothetical protein